MDVSPKLQYTWTIECFPTAAVCRVVLDPNAGEFLPSNERRTWPPPAHYSLKIFEQPCESHISTLRTAQGSWPRPRFPLSQQYRQDNIHIPNFYPRRPNIVGLAQLNLYGQISQRATQKVHHFSTLNPANHMQASLLHCQTAKISRRLVYAGK